MHNIFNVEAMKFLRLHAFRIISSQIGSVTFEFLDGVVGIAFSPRLQTVYYQPLANDRIFSVSTSALQAGPLGLGQQLPVTTIGRKSSQGLPLAVNPQDDTILFAPLTETAIASWQPRTNQQRCDKKFLKYVFSC